MPPIRVLVAAASPDIKAEGISVAVERRDDMVLAENRAVSLFEVESHLRAIPPEIGCALILIGNRSDAQRLETRLLAEKRRLVILHLDVVDDLAKIALRDPQLDSLLTSLCDLLADADAERRVMVVPAYAPEPTVPTAPASRGPERERVHGELWGLAGQWLRLLLRNAANAVADNQGGALGFTVTPEGVGNILADPGPVATGAHEDPELQAADAALAAALQRPPAETSDPLAALLTRFGLDHNEQRVLLLALAPEIDVRFQRCIGLLLDDAGRRAPTLSLCAALLGEQARIRADLAHAGQLARWRLFEGQEGGLPHADEPLRIHRSLIDWAFGLGDALSGNGEALRVLRSAPWPGASLFSQIGHEALATAAIGHLRGAGSGESGHVHLYDDDAFPDWRALLERGAQAAGTALLRIDGARLCALEPAQIDAACTALAWISVLQGQPLLLDTRACESGAQGEEAVRRALRTLFALNRRVGWIGSDLPRSVRLLGDFPHTLVAAPVEGVDLALQHAQAAARLLGIDLQPAAARLIAASSPLHAAGFEQAMRLARATHADDDAPAARLQRFVEACQEVASEGASGLATSLSPAFALVDVVLPPECERQLREIVDSVRLAPQVLDAWKFREQLPYGRGIAALFQGPSGTGKTMSALGIAHELRTRVLRLDLSRVVSKYIGDTEKNIDRVFEDARQSGAVIVIDEADALLGKRSEVKDAHDRYANIEVAYLLQRIENHDGLAIFTTNLRQNLDSAFLRRLRFIIDFPRPDAAAREEIWRRCLPAGSHALGEADFRQLGRKIDLTGGHIRQITLRAAFIAAAAGEKIGIGHIARASRAELAKLGLAPVELETPQRREAA
ncbi:MAG: ATP-binding protein [Pseudoxanthomonas sp.]